MTKLMKVINWWENKLSSTQRRKLLGRKNWTGNIAERHKRLLKFYSKRKK